MSGAYLPLIGTALTHGPWVAGAAALIVTPAGYAAIAAVLERRLLRPGDEFAALVFGDPLLAVAVALGAWLLRGASPGFVAGPPFGLACLAGGLIFGVVEWRVSVRGGFYTRAQALAPTMIWHQLVVYPVLGYWVWTAGLGGLLTAPGPAVNARIAGGPVASHDLAKAVIAACVLTWLLANVYDRWHPKLGHPPYDWRALRPERSPWPAQSTSLRAHLARLARRRPWL